ncbi:MAG: hypothetical protein RLZZ226_376, partial [Pseudomonadota bacterium]
MSDWFSLFTPPVLSALFIGTLLGSWLTGLKLKGHDPARCDKRARQDADK